MDDFPPVMVWAWERPEDLGFVDCSKGGGAYLVGTLTLTGGEVSMRTRLQALEVPDECPMLAVVRLESRRTGQGSWAAAVTKDADGAREEEDQAPESDWIEVHDTFAAPKLSDQQRTAALAEILAILPRNGVRGLQIDFDARESEKEFYQALLDDLAPKPARAPARPSACCTAATPTRPGPARLLTGSSNLGPGRHISYREGYRRSRFQRWKEQHEGGEKQMEIQVKRVYEDVEDADGRRILVDRLWPRGRSKQSARIDYWAKDIAPSHELRRWYQHDPAKWDKFRARYFKELDENAAAASALQSEMQGSDRVTFLYSSKERVLNNATALREYLEACAAEGEG